MFAAFASAIGAPTRAGTGWSCASPIDIPPEFLSRPAWRIEPAGRPVARSRAMHEPGRAASPGARPASVIASGGPVAACAALAAAADDAAFESPMNRGNDIECDVLGTGAEGPSSDAKDAVGWILAR